MTKLYNSNAVYVCVCVRARVSSKRDERCLAKKGNDVGGGNIASVLKHLRSERRN